MDQKTIFDMVDLFSFKLLDFFGPGVTVSGKILLGETICHQTNNSSLSPDEIFRPIKVKVSLVEVQVNPRR